MIYKIIGEAHEGVWSCDEECLYEVEAKSPDEALLLFSTTDSRVHFSDHWGIWLMGAREIWVERKEE